MAYLYLPLILWALHQLLGTDKGNKAYAELGPIITEQLHPTALSAEAAPAAPIETPNIVENVNP